MEYILDNNCFRVKIYVEGAGTPLLPLLGAPTGLEPKTEISDLTELVSGSVYLFFQGSKTVELDT